MDDNEAPRRPTALVLDAEPLWRSAADALLRRLELEPVGLTSSPDVASFLLAEHEPDIFLIDIDFPTATLDGILALERARRRHPATVCVVLSHRADVHTVESALAAGAVDYVSKTSELDEIEERLLEAVRFCAPAADRDGRATGRGGLPSAASRRLTRRELEILRLVAEGRSNREVARLLWVTEHAVKFHLANVYRKLDVHNRVQAAEWAYRAGLAAAPLPEAARGRTGSTGRRTAPADV